MTDVKLIAIVAGNKKDGSGMWYRATLKGHNSLGKPVVNDFYLDPSVGEKAIRDGIVEDCAITVGFDFDDYMRPTITELAKVSGSTGSKAQVTG